MTENEKIENLMSLEVLENILGRERIAAIAEEALKDDIQWFLSDKRNLENIMFRISYECMLRYIDETWNTDRRKVCADKIKQTIEGDEYFVYRMFEDKHEGRKILDEEINNARGYLKDRIREVMDNKLDIHMDGQDFMEWIWEGAIYKLFSEKAKDEVKHINDGIHFYSENYFSKD